MVSVAVALIKEDTKVKHYQNGTVYLIRIPVSTCNVILPIGIMLRLSYNFTAMYLFGFSSMLAKTYGTRFMRSELRA